MKKLLSVAFLFAMATVALGCGGATGYKRITAKAMPELGLWDGVFHSQAYGRMELTANGSTVYGLYEAERWYGKIEGEADGDVLRFRWTQWNEDLNGKTRESRGNGYFRYTVKQEGTPEKPRYAHFIDGEWGYNDDNSGNPWNAVKFPDGTKKQLRTRGAEAEGMAAPASSDPFAGGQSASGDSSPSGSSGGGLDNSSSGSGPSDDDLDDLF